MPATEISVIIPTYNRSAVLHMTLLALGQQTLPPDQFEVILVDDGSTEDLPGTLTTFKLPYALRFLQQSQCGPAAARNLGASQGLGEILLFLDSDMIATPGFLKSHLESHNGADQLVAGPRSIYNDTADLFEKADYRVDGTDPRLDKLPLTFQEAFTCNLSVRKRIWDSLGGFNERFTSFEDIDFAYRAVKAGYQIKFNLAALAYHYHPLSFQERCRRAVSYTQTVPLLYKTHPELRGKIIHLQDKEPIAWGEDNVWFILRKLARYCLSSKPVLHSLEWILKGLLKLRADESIIRFFYWKIIGAYQWRGLRQGIHLYGWPE